MNLIAQIKKILNELFETSGFGVEQTTKMTELVINLWLSRSFFSIVNLFSKKEKTDLDNISKSLNSDGNNEDIMKELFELISGLDENKREEATNIILNEAGDIVERLINKFYSKSTKDQKKVFMQKLSKIIKPID